MVGWILKKILGSKNQREIKRMMPMVRRINELDEQFKSLSDDELRAKTAAWNEELVKMESVEEQWDVPGLESALHAEYKLQAPVGEWLKAESEIDEETIRARVFEVAQKAWRQREEQIGADVMRRCRTWRRCLSARCLAWRCARAGCCRSSRRSTCTR